MTGITRLANEASEAMFRAQATLARDRAPVAAAPAATAHHLKAPSRIPTRDTA
ncbi:hypothetical protein [Streptomyces sp. HC307]|uniref:hypothetical protein n=1 Tax=Streptomyces flavusporus TaxID=3385496 RepID=UPI00391731B2